MVRACALLLATIASGCAYTVPSVRAERRHAREPARALVVRARVADLEAAVALSRAILTETPYREGDSWPRALAMSDGASERIEERIRQDPPFDDSDLQVAPISIYRRHVETVVARGRAADGEGRSAGVVQAVAAVSEAGRSMEALLVELDAERRELAAAGARVGALRHASRASATEAEGRETRAALASAEAARDSARDRVDDVARRVAGAARDLGRDEGVSRRLARDLQSAVSAAYRLLAEARGLRGVVDKHALLALPRPDGRTRRALRRSAERLARPQAEVSPVAARAPDPVALPLRIGAVAADTDAVGPLFERLGNALGPAASRELDDAPGLASDDSLADDVAGFAWDSFFAKARAGGDMLLFSNLIDRTTEPDEDSEVSFDYTGRGQYLRYQVDPIVLVGTSSEVGVSLFRIPRFFTLKFDYGTDRFFRRGGAVSGGNASSQLGITGRVSDLIEGTLHAGGLDTSVRIARFDFGEVEIVDAATGEVNDRFPFQLEQFQLDVTYDLRHVIDPLWLVGVADSIRVGFRYLDYRVPRILYEFEDQNPDPDRDEYTLVGETGFVQNIESQYFLGGIRIVSFDDPSSTHRLVLDAGFFAGAGPGRFRYPGPDDRRSQTLLALLIPVRVGYKLPLMSASNPFQLDFVASYQVELLHANTVGTGSDTDAGEGEDSDLGTRTIRFGSTDFFHGPSVWLKGSL